MHSLLHNTQEDRNHIVQAIVEMEINRMATLGRAFSYEYPTNRLISIISLFAIISITVASITNDETISASLLAGFRAGLLIFLLWAISRELDPDNAWSAFVPVVLGLLVLTFSEIPTLIVFLWFLMILRVVNHSTGLPAGILDTLFITLLGIVMIYYISWIYGIMTAAAFVIDSQLKDKSKYHLIAGILTLIVSVIAYIENGGPIFIQTLEYPYPVILGSILFIPGIADKKKLVSVGDKTGKSLDVTRIRAAKLMAMIFFLLIAAIQGEMNVLITPFMAGIFAGIGAYHIASIVVAKTGI